MNKVSVIGAGSWGTALANVLSDNGYNVFLHTINEQVADEINSQSTNHKYLPNVVLSNNIICSTDYEDVLKNSELILLVVPSHALRETSKKILPYLNENMTIVHATKGIEIESLKTMTNVLEEEFPTFFKEKIVVLSGPSHAEEVARRLPTTIVAANSNLDIAKKVQSIFTNSYFRVYTNEDILGVELGGSLKNIIALGAGLSDGLGFGDNAKAALLTRGLSEIIKLGTFLGANPLTFSGLTGIGDLIVTGTSKHSRNWKTGNMLAQGYSLEETLNNLGMVAEGVKTTKSAYFLAKRENVETPIINTLYGILFENANPKEAVHTLMTRAYKNEI